MRKSIVRGLWCLLAVGLVLVVLGCIPRPLDDDALQVAVEKVILKCSGEPVVGRFKGWGPTTKAGLAVRRAAADLVYRFSESPYPEWASGCGAELGFMREKQRIVVVVDRSVSVTPRLKRRRLELAVPPSPHRTDEETGVVSVDAIERKDGQTVIQAGYVFGDLGAQGVAFAVQRTWLGLSFTCRATWVS